jgi:hypothetical protein
VAIFEGNLTPDEHNPRDWRQNSAFDSARECEDVKSLQIRSSRATDIGTIARRPIERLSDDELRARLWLLSRCVPAQ